MVESTSLLTRQGVKTLDGSNPSVSANFRKVFLDAKLKIIKTLVEVPSDELLK